MICLLRLILGFICIGYGCIGFSHSISSHQSATNSRLWSDKNGVELVRGSFYFENQGTVQIVDGNDKIQKLSLRDLSLADQSFVEARNKTIKAINKMPMKHDFKKGLLSVSLFLFAITIVFGLRSRFQTYRMRIYGSLFLALGGIVFGCSNDDSATTDETTAVESGTEFSSTVASIKSAFDVYSLSTSSDSNYFYVESNGIPDHQMMVGITAWIAQVPLPQSYTGTNSWSIPLTASYAASPVSLTGNFQRGAVAIAANGIPIFNPVNASGEVSGEIGELDEFGGHAGRGDDYHYHTAPMHLESTSVNLPIAYALDGFAIYGSKEPDGGALATLDDYQGHEYNSVYHYHGTESYPYVMTAMRGEVTLEGDAPQNQITPQPRADPPRQGDPHPINGDNLLITGLTENSTNNGYTLTYTIGDVEGSVVYSWDVSGTYTYIFNDVNGDTTTETW